MKLGLGTVQFGLNYGISNRAGKTAPLEAREILGLAAQHGIRVLDTAAGYGESEEVLGLALSETRWFSVVTKTPAFRGKQITDASAGELKRSFHDSLRKLQQPKIYGLLAHSADDLLAPGGERLVEAMLELKGRGLVSKIGASVYGSAQVEALLERCPIDLIQLPLNVFDQRLLAGGQLRHLKDAGIEVHARSVFLQGLLLMPAAGLPAYFDPIREHLACFHAFARDSGMSPIQAALDFALGVAEVDHVILGVNTRHQLLEILSQPPAGAKPEAWRKFALDQTAMLDPSQWRLN